jgi:thiamine biosynthesis lipoprotein
MNGIICSKTYQVMGGDFQFLCFPQTYMSKDEVYQLFDEAFNEVKRIEMKYTDFKPSPFNQINQFAGVRPVLVDEETIFLIKESLIVSERSCGIFDISFASIGHLWREKKEKNEVLNQETIKNQLKYINYKLIEIDEQDKTVYLPFSQMRVGLGGIGKGYAVDQVYRFFIKKGLYNFYINGSGDIRVHSRLDAPRKWRIGIRNPLSADASKSVGVIQMGIGAIASSGGYIHNVNGDKFNHHIINPKTGVSNREIIASTVLADDALIADTTATILMNMNKGEAVKYLNDHNLMGLVFCSSGNSYLSNKALANFGMSLKSRS